MDSKFNYKFSNQAKKDLDDIVYYITVQLSNGDAAKKFLDKIVDEIQTICVFPRKAPIFENSFLPKLEIRKVVIDNYVMFYTVNEKEKVIKIITIQYSKKSLDEIARFLNI